MIKTSQIVKPLSTYEIKQAAIECRNSSPDFIDENGAIDVVKILELKYTKYEIVPNETLRNAYAITKSSGEILISEEVYDQACDGDYRARFTIAHELGHAYMHTTIDGFAQGKDKACYTEIYYDSEWQANTFAAELLIPTSTLKDLLNKGVPVEVISKNFKVSKQCLEVKMHKM